jgi:hypothetical protein
MVVMTLRYVNAEGRPVSVQAERSGSGRWWHLYVEGVPASRVTAKTLEQAQKALENRCRALGMKVKPALTSRP